MGVKIARHGLKSQRARDRQRPLNCGSAWLERFPSRSPSIITPAISSRWRRQLDSSDEYSPSRRRSAPTSPSPLQASASRSIRSLYSAVKRRRFACSLTSGSGATTASRLAGSTLALPAPSDPAKFVFSVNRLIHDPPPPSTLISRGGVSQACWHGGGRGIARGLSIVGALGSSVFPQEAHPSSVSRPRWRGARDASTFEA